MIRLHPLRPKSFGVSKEEGNGEVTEKRERKLGEIRSFVRVKSISYF